MRKRKGNLPTLLSGVALAAATSAQAAVLTTSGDINTPANWDTGTLPAAGEIATVNINSSWPSTASANALGIFGDLIFGGGSTLTANIDVVGFNPSSVTFNDVTVNVGDDIFTGGGGVGNFIFNDGSITNVDDDFEANGGGTITVNGGTHNVGVAAGQSGNFGSQNGSTLNFLGGTVTALRLTNGSGNLNVGGDAILTANTIIFAGTGAFDIAADWTGSLTIPGVNWETTLTSDATFDGAAIDATVFAENFLVEGNTVSLIPEPSAALLGALGFLGLLRRRR